MHDIAEVDAPFAPLKPDEIVPVPAPASDGELVLPVPADAPPMPEAHFELGRPSADGHIATLPALCCLLYARFDKTDGSKEFLPLTLWRDAQGLRWRWKSVPAPRPLYNLDKLAGRPDAAGGHLRRREICRRGRADFSEIGGHDCARWRKRGRQGGLERASRAQGFNLARRRCTWAQLCRESRQRRWRRSIAIFQLSTPMHSRGLRPVAARANHQNKDGTRPTP